MAKGNRTKKKKQSSRVTCGKCNPNRAGRKYTVTPPQECPNCQHLTGTFYRRKD
ncbi:hypothetical protein KJ903_01465 [Patescibacteria group bacterium]|nr:hypothetical protein [Patescibacteria group bacterium]